MFLNPQVCISHKIAFNSSYNISFTLISTQSFDLVISSHVDPLIQSDDSWEGCRQEMQYLTTA